MKSVFKLKVSSEMYFSPHTIEMALPIVITPNANVHHLIILHIYIFNGTCHTNIYKLNHVTHNSICGQCK